MRVVLEGLSAVSKGISSFQAIGIDTCRYTCTRRGHRRMREHSRIRAGMRNSRHKIAEETEHRKNEVRERVKAMHKE